MKHYPQALIILFSCLSLSGQNFDPWTVWMQGGRMEFDSSCTFNFICDDQNPESFDHCNGEWCINTFPSSHTFSKVIDMEVDFEGNIWAIGEAAGGIGIFPHIAMYDGESWYAFNRDNSAFGKPNPDPFPPQGNSLSLINLSVSPTGVIHCLSQNYELYKFEEGIWERNLLANTGMTSSFLDLAEIDHEGKIWIAGRSPVELAVWDSTSWTVYSTANSPLQNRSITAIDFSSNGDTWIGTAGDGVLQLDLQGVWTQYTRTNHAIKRDEISDLRVINDSIWITTSSAGISLFDGNIWADLATQDFFSTGPIASGQTKDFWVGTNNGLARFNGASWDIIYSDSLNMPAGIVRAQLIDISGNIWVEQRSGSPTIGKIGFIAENVYTPIRSSFTEPYNFFPSSTGDLIYNEKNGTWRYDGTDLSVDSFANPNAGYRYFAEDLSGNWWSSSGQSSIVRFDGVNNTNWNPQNSSLPDNIRINGIFLSQNGTIWIKSITKGVAYFDGNDWVVFNTANSGISSDFIIGIGQAADGTIIIVDSGGRLNFFDGSNWIIKNANIPGQSTLNEAYLAIKDTSNIWYTKDGHGLIHYFQGNINSYTTGNSGLSSDQFAGMVRQANGDIWLATRVAWGGVIVFDGNTWEILTRDNSPLPHGSIWAMKKDKFGNTWIGGRGYVAKIDNSEDPLYPVSGTVFYDANSNGLLDSTELGIPHQKLIFTPGNSIVFSNQDGKYNTFLPPGNYEVELIPSLQYQTSVGTNKLTFVLDFLNLESRGNNFGLIPSETGVDVAGNLAVGRWRCDRETRIWLTITNRGGSIADSSELQLILDDRTVFRSADVQPNLQLGDTLIWQVGELLPLESQTIEVFAEPQQGTIGDTLFTQLLVSSMRDGSLNNNRDSSDSPFFCSFDPNDKLNQPKGIGENFEIKLGQDIVYTIRFQNTGNDTAYQVSLLDTIDTNLSLESLEILGASHTFETFYLGNRLLQFKFDNIFLPDSLTNPAKSQGYIKYRISPKTMLRPGTSVYNKAAIYFDANPPIITNTTQNTYVDFFTSRIPFVKKNPILVFPNPTRNKLGVDLSNLSPAQLVKIELINLYGVRVQLFPPPNPGDRTFDLHLSESVKPGYYFLSFQFKREKFIVKISVQ